MSDAVILLTDVRRSFAQGGVVAQGGGAGQS